jgi:NADPH-ferrihemoprotein reductase
MAIFCMATYGEGDPTDNAQQFHDFLQAGNADLTGLRYAVCLVLRAFWDDFFCMFRFDLIVLEGFVYIRWCF